MRIGITVWVIAASLLLTGCLQSEEPLMPQSSNEGFQGEYTLKNMGDDPADHQPTAIYGMPLKVTLAAGSLSGKKFDRETGLWKPDGSYQILPSDRQSGEGIIERHDAESGTIAYHFYRQTPTGSMQIWDVDCKLIEQELKRELKIIADVRDCTVKTWPQVKAVLAMYMGKNPRPDYLLDRGVAPALLHPTADEIAQEKRRESIRAERGELRDQAVDAVRALGRGDWPGFVWAVWRGNLISVLAVLALVVLIGVRWKSRRKG